MVFLIGALVGMTGIGGLALAPAIHAVAGVPLDNAIATAMVCFVFSGLTGSLLFARFGAIEWRAVPVLLTAVAATAFPGALLLPAISEPVLRLALAGLMLLAGAQGLLGARQQAVIVAGAALPSSAELLVIGILTGFGSALSGTGGPVILIPILLLFGTPARTAIGLAQVVQIPIGLSATAGHHFTGTLEPVTAVPFAIAIAGGVAAGALVVGCIPVKGLQTLVSCALILFGIVFLL